jgi:ubiquinone/menaquinone biosynthesis C-methylase UbiE
MSKYIHGSDPDEQFRLSKLNELINDRCLSLLAIQSGDHILDVGSGLGQFTLAMGDRTGPRGKCLGIERDENQLEAALKNLDKVQMPWVEFRPGNAEELGLSQEEWGTYHLVHARFILEHVRNPEGVVSGMARAARSGGKVVLADDDHDLMKLSPSPPGFDTIWTAYIRSYESLGNDPLVGRRLVTLLHQSGLTRIKNNVVFFGDSAGTETFPAYVRNLIGILQGAREIMLTNRLIGEHSFNESLHQLEQWGKREDAALWYVINWAEGSKA